MDRNAYDTSFFFLYIYFFYQAMNSFLSHSNMDYCWVRFPIPEIHPVNQVCDSYAHGTRGRLRLHLELKFDFWGHVFGEFLYGQCATDRA